MRHNYEEARADTCYHEAAHAVFDYHARLPIRLVYVTEELEAMCVSGHPEHSPWWKGIVLAAE